MAARHRNTYTKGYEDRYSASIARAENLLDGTASFGRFVNDRDYSEGRSEFSDSVASPAPSESTMSRAEDASPMPGGRPGGEGTPNAPNAPLAPPPRRVKTSEDARLGAMARTCGCATPFRGYSSVFSYVVGFGWLLDAVGANTPAPENMRIRRSMSSRIAVEALQDNDDDER